MAKTPKKTRTMRAAKAEKAKPRWAVLVPVGNGLDPVAIELPDPTNAADGCLIYVKGGKYVLSGAPLNQDCYPYWDNATKTIKWSAV